MDARRYSEIAWVNFLGFQLVWWSCVLLGNSAVPVVLVALALHLYFHSQPRREAALVLVAACLGIVVDSALTLLGVFQFPNDTWLIPLWLIVLWFGFCATLRQGLNFLDGRYLVGAALGAIGGSTSYLSAAKLGAVELGLSWISTTVILTLIWALLMPTLLYCRHCLEVRHASQAP